MQTKVTYLLRAISISLRKINLNLAPKLNQRNLAPKLNQSQSRSGAQSHRSELNICIPPSLSSISAQSRFNRGPSNSDTTRTATIKRLYISRQSDLLTRQTRFTRSLSQLTVLPLALSRFAQSTFKEQHQNDFNTGKQRVSHGTQLQGPFRRIAIVCDPLAENSNRLRPFLQLCASESRSLASTES